MLVAAALYARYIEPRWFQVTHYEVTAAGLPKSLDGLKIVQLSDIHRNGSGRDYLIKRAVGITNRESPDIAVITGDFVSGSSANAPGCARILSMINAKRGTYAVLGNHDYWHGVDGVKRALRREGIVLLTNDNRRIAGGLYLIGIDDAWAGHPDVGLAWSGVDESAAQVLLSHTPVAARLFAGKKCLALTGHTHGGEVDLPPIPRSMLPGLLGCRYVKGWFKVGQANMYVNRGIGIVNPFHIRFHSRPEISVFVLRSPNRKEK